MTREEFGSVLSNLLGPHARPERAAAILAVADDSGDYEGVLQAVINGRVAADWMAGIRDRQRPGGYGDREPGMTGGAGSFYRELRQESCGYCLAPAGDPCRTRAGRVLLDGHEHLVRVQAWRARWQAAQPRPSRKARKAVAAVTVAHVAAGMRNRPGFAEETP